MYIQEEKCSRKLIIIDLKFELKHHGLRMLVDNEGVGKGIKGNLWMIR